MVFELKNANFTAKEFGFRESDELPNLPIDAWTASSLLQKAIRRGEVRLAEQAALRYWRLRGQGIWRRLVLIAFEDVGVGSPAAVIRTVTTAQTMLTPALRRAYDPQVAARIIVRDLAAAPKDRSTDYLIATAIHDPALGWFRDECARQSVEDRIASAAAGDLPLHLRATAAWFASDMNVGGQPCLPAGDRQRLLRAFRDIGVPAELVEATDAALSITRAAICIVLPLLWSAWVPERARSTAKLTAPPSAPTIGAVPLWTFDKHTSLGKAAITRFAVENDEVRSTLSRWARPDAARDAACMATFYTDAIPVSPRLDWSLSASLESEGRRVDMSKVGVPWDGVSPIMEAVRDNLDHLNEIRARLLRRTPAPARSEP